MLEVIGYDPKPQPLEVPAHHTGARKHVEQRPSGFTHLSEDAGLEELQKRVFAADVVHSGVGICPD